MKRARRLFKFLDCFTDGETNLPILLIFALIIVIIFVLFKQLEARQVAPPFKPMIEDQYGLENFDPQFTNEPVQLTPDDP